MTKKINLIDMDSLFPKERKYFNDGYHFNEKGASLFADILSSSYCELN
jgi:lysophospholipase L1-like esterase